MQSLTRQQSPDAKGTPDDRGPTGREVDVHVGDDPRGTSRTARVVRGPKRKFISRSYSGPPLHNIRAFAANVRTSRSGVNRA
jgi:hypothetical protein